LAAVTSAVLNAKFTASVRPAIRPAYAEHVDLCEQRGRPRAVPS